MNIVIRYLGSIALSLCCYNQLQAGTDATTTVSATANNELLGGELNQSIAVFRGIPFAQAPIGALRWQAPQAHIPRPGPQDATEFADACMQGPHIVDWYKDLVVAFERDPAVVQSPPFSEDCLYLNIWTPALNVASTQAPKADTKKLPVMVWIHGGSNKGGWAYEPNYLGHALAQQQVVVVSIAYRLGVFGFFAHPQLSQQQAISANFGLLDQIAALKWIQQHIHAFGGDAQNITVFGESAGAANIAYLIASPLAKGLFQRAIHQSAGFQMAAHNSRVAEEPLGVALATELNIDPHKPAIEQLRAIDAQQLLAATEKAYAGHYFAPLIDQHVLQDEPLQTFATQQQNSVSLMIGSNAHEWYMYLDEATDHDAVNDYIDANTEPAGQLALKQWAQQQADPRLALDRLTTAREMLCPSYYMAARVAENNRSWVYFFSQQRAGKGGAALKAYHGAEIAYVFDTHDDWLPTSKSDQALTTLMVQYWSNFAKSGDPNGDKLPDWPQYTDRSAAAMELGNNVGAIPLPEPLLCQWLAPTPVNPELGKQ